MLYRLVVNESRVETRFNRRRVMAAILLHLVTVLAVLRLFEYSTIYKLWEES